MISKIVLISSLLLFTGCSQPNAKPGFDQKSSADASADSTQYSDQHNDKAMTQQADNDETSTAASNSNSVMTGASTDAMSTNASSMTSKADDLTLDASADTSVKTVDCKSLKFDWKKIASPEEVTCLGSVSKVFNSFEDWQKPYFSFMKKSMSNQPASATYPRVITYAPSGNYIVAAATDPSKQSELEVAVYDYKKEVWQFAGINFGSNPPTVEKKLCTKCHGDILRPIWSDYPFWPGAVSEAVNGQHGMSQEDADYMNKVASGDSSIPAIMKIFKYKSPGSYSKGGVIFSNTPYGVSENHQLLNLYAVQKATRMVVSRIMKDKNVTLEQKINIFKKSVCGPGTGDDTSAFTAMGYPMTTWTYHGIVGTKTDHFPGQNMWQGGEREAYFIGLELMRQTLLAEPALASKLPDTVKLFDNIQYTTLYEPDTAKVLQTLEDKKWHVHKPYDYVSGVLKPYFRPDAAGCKAIMDL